MISKSNNKLETVMYLGTRIPLFLLSWGAVTEVFNRPYIVNSPWEMIVALFFSLVCLKILLAPMKKLSLFMLCKYIKERYFKKPNPLYRKRHEKYLKPKKKPKMSRSDLSDLFGDPEKPIEDPKITEDPIPKVAYSESGIVFEGPSPSIRSVKDLRRERNGI